MELCAHPRSERPENGQLCGRIHLLQHPSEHNRAAMLDEGIHERLDHMVRTFLPILSATG